MKLFEVSRRLEIVGMDSDRYKTPFPVQVFPLDLSIMIKERLQSAPVKKVSLSSLTSIQNSVSKKGVSDYKKKSGEPVMVAEVNGKNVLLDGTHRATAAWVKGDSDIDAHFLKFVDLDTKNSHRLNIQELHTALDKAQQ